MPKTPRLLASIDVRGIPEIVAAARTEMANALRATADAEPSGYVRDRLRAIAAAYEAGQGSDG